MANIAEIWKDIPGHDGYQASSYGNIKSIKRYGRRKDKVLSFAINTSGYPQLKVSSKTKRIHRLVAEAFLPNPENKSCVNHKNGIKIDNRIDNLEWCTHSENGKHAFLTGLNKPPIGERHGMSKLSNRDVKAIRNIFKQNGNQKKIADDFNVSIHTIKAITRRRLWKHI